MLVPLLGLRAGLDRIGLLLVGLGKVAWRSAWLDSDWDCLSVVVKEERIKAVSWSFFHSGSQPVAWCNVCM